MIIVMSASVGRAELEAVEQKLERLGFRAHLIRGVARNVIGAVGTGHLDNTAELELMPGVEKVVRVMAPYKLVSREFIADDTRIRVAGGLVGGEEITIMAGPCAVESEEQLESVAREVKAAGAAILRGGAFKPRTSPYSFQGLEKEGLLILDAVRRRQGIGTITEVIDPHDVELVAQSTDILQIGARNMQNFSLLKEVGRQSKPVLLKRGIAATIEEWLMAAEYIMDAGNYNVMLCERGIRTFETATRNTLDLSAVPIVQRLSHLPVIVDPSHSSGDWRLVHPLSLAAIAAGADGLLIEVHNNPKAALCDGQQSLSPEKFRLLMRDLQALAAVIGRTLPTTPSGAASTAR